MGTKKDQVRYHGAITVSLLTAVILAVLPTSGSYAKPQLPVTLEVTLVEPALPKDKQRVIVKVEAAVPIKDTDLTVVMPQKLDGESSVVFLWTGTLAASGEITETLDLGVLPEGKHTLYVSFRFAMQDGTQQTAHVARSLFIDARANKILSSNVSFRHIRRIELRNRIQQLGLAKTPINELRFTHPDLADEIRNLNRLDPTTRDLNGETKQSGRVLLTDDHGEPLHVPTPPDPSLPLATERVYERAVVPEVPVKPARSVVTDDRGEPTRTPTPPSADTRPTTEEPRSEEVKP